MYLSLERFQRHLTQSSIADDVAKIEHFNIIFYITVLL